MILGKIQARKFSEVFDGRCIVGASRLLTRIEIAKMDLLSIGDDLRKPSVSSLLKADALVSACVIAQLFLIAMILAVSGWAQVVNPIIAVIHVFMVNQMLRHLTMDEEPSETASEITITFEADYPVAIRHNASGLRADGHPWFRRLYPSKYAGFRVVRKVLLDEIQAHNLMIQHLVCRYKHATGVV